MGKAISPTWEALDDVVASANQALAIFTPYYSGEALDRVLNKIRTGVSLRFATRLSPSDWLYGSASPTELVSFLACLQTQGSDIQLLIHQTLHAKAYMADNRYGLIGSANLTGGGFHRNFELMVRLDEDECLGAMSILNRELADHARRLDLEEFSNWVGKFRSQVESAGTRQAEPADELAGMQRELDGLLGHGTQGFGATYSPTIQVEDFIGWAESKPHYAGTRLIIERYRNPNGQNLTGHVRQCYYALAHFFIQCPQHVAPLSGVLLDMNRDALFRPDQALLADWIRHLEGFATLSGDAFDYAILRGILPPSVGGTRSNGGGAISTLKRMMPLVARFIGEEPRT